MVSWLIKYLGWYNSRFYTFASHIMPFSESYQQRFGGIIRLYGTKATERLARAHVLVIGIGGVGSWAAEALARSGVGAISLMDLDDICITNTNRQVHAVHSQIGQSKVAATCARLRDINPEIRADALDDFLDKENIAQYIEQHYTIVIDAIDSTMTKAALIAHCKRQKTPLITIGSSGGKKDPTMMTYGDLSRTKNDPLLAKVRNNLRRLHGFSRNTQHTFSVEAIYSTEQMTYPDDKGETCKHREFLDNGGKLDCSSGYGAATMMTASFGLLASTRAIEKIIRRKKH